MGDTAGAGGQLAEEGERLPSSPIFIPSSDHFRKKSQNWSVCLPVCLAICKATYLLPKVSSTPNVGQKLTDGPARHSTKPVFLDIKYKPDHVTSHLVLFNSCSWLSR